MNGARLLEDGPRVVNLGLAGFADDLRHNGAPVVCSDIAGHRETIEHEQTGLLFPPGDLPAMTKETHRILHDEELRRRIIRNAKASVAKRSWRAAACVRDK